MVGGAVYQPTTVSYEEGGGGVVSGWRGALSPRTLQWLLLVCCCVSLVVGLSLVVDGSVGLQHAESTSSSTLLVVVGILLVVVGLGLGAAFLRVMRRRRACPCFSNKEERLAAVDTQPTLSAQTCTQNPSTDLLVTAQYAPVSEVAYQAPASRGPSSCTGDHEETSHLMPMSQELIKDCSEESERMLESDPRIVLRPLSSHTDEA